MHINVIKIVETRVERVKKLYFVHKIISKSKISLNISLLKK